jgi:hypothetical protein
MDEWEADLVGVRDLAMYNDVVKYLLTAINVFSKLLNILPLKKDWQMCSIDIPGHIFIGFLLLQASKKTAHSAAYR